VENTSAERVETECKLTNDETADLDKSIVTSEPLDTGPTHFAGDAAISLEASAKMTAPGHWLVKCVDDKEVLNSADLKIHAVSVGSLSNTHA